MRTSTLTLSVLLVASSPRRQEADLVLEHFSQQRGAYGAGLLTSKKQQTLRVMNGGAFTTVARPSPSLLAELLEMSGLDAIAVGYDDLPRISSGLREILKSPKLPWVCANVKGAGKAYVVRQAGSIRVAFVGVTKPPTHRKAELLEGWTIEDPVTALKGLLPEINRNADVVVLLAVMDRIECSTMLKVLQGIHVALVPAVGGNDPEPLQVGSTFLVQSPSGTDVIGGLSLKREGNKVSGATNRIEAIIPTSGDHDRVRALFAKHKEGLDPGRLVVSSAPGLAGESGPLTSLEPGKAQSLNILRSGRSVEARVAGVQASTAYGNRRVPPGALWLVIQSEWKNIIPPSSEGLSTAFAVSDATNNLYLVVNGRTLVRLEADLSSGPGGLLDGRSIAIKSFGEIRRGTLVFPVPASGVETLDLRYYDFRHPALTFPILARSQEAKATGENPVVPLTKNEIVQIGIFGVRRAKSLGERKAPEGMTYVLIDFRARSLANVEGEGKAQIGAAGDLTEMWKSLRLTVDGGRSFTPCEGTELTDTLRLLPDVLTGGDLAYLVPEKTSSLELRCSFGKIALPDGRIVEPRPMSLLLEGKAQAKKIVCPKCLREAGPNDKFCGNCGTKIER